MCSVNFLFVLLQGILDAMKNREKLQRSKSETNLKSKHPTRGEKRSNEQDENETGRSISEGESDERLPPLHCVSRPKSWSPEYGAPNILFTARSQGKPQFDIFYIIKYSRNSIK